MKDRYLEVTFRRGRALAGYLYLPRQPGTRSARTESAGPGLRVDYAATGEAIGIQITAPAQVTLEQLNSVLERLGFTALEAGDIAPLRAAQIRERAPAQPALHSP